MNPRQLITKHLQRLISALLPGGYWHVSQLLASPCPAERVAIKATVQAMPNRGDFRGFGKA